MTKQGFIADFMKYLEFVEAPERFKVWSAISTVSACLERKVWTAFDGVCYPNLYIMFVASPGMGKTLASNRSYELITHIPEIAFGSTTGTSANFIKDMAAAGINKKFQYQGKTYNHSAMYLYSSESVATLKNHEGTLVWLLNDFYDCPPLQGWTDEVCWKKGTLTGGETKIFNSCVSMLGCCTPELLSETIMEQNFKSGFGSRCLFIVDTSRRTIIPWREKRDTSHMMRPLINQLKTIAKYSGVYTVSDTYRDMYDALRQECADNAAKNAENFMAGYYARKAWNIRKVSLVLAAAESARPVITEEHLLYAQALFKNVEATLTSTFNHADKSEETQNMFRVWNAMLNSGQTTFTLSFITVLFISMQRDQVLMCLKRLSEMGRIKINVTARPITYEIIDRTPLV